MKTAIALCGGGSRGSYHIGVWQALRELDFKFDIVTGTSIGALNGAFMVQNDFKSAIELWNKLTINNVILGGINLDISFEGMYNQKAALMPFFKHYLSKKGADITPFLKILDDYCDPPRFFASPIDFGLVTVEFPSFLPHEITKAELTANNLRRYLLASSSCFPAFPLCKIEDKNYIDGGYYDNLPISLALKMGADEVLAIDLHTNASHPQYIGKPFITYSKPYWELGSFLLFEHETIQSNMRLGYLDTLKKFGRLSGFRYSFDTAEDAQKIEYGSRNLLLLINEIEAEIGNKNQNAIVATISKGFSPYPLTDILMEYTDNLPLSPIGYLLRAAETAGEIVHLDPLRLYTLTEFNELLLSSFNDGKNYNYKVLFRQLTNIKNPAQIKAAFKNIDLHYLVGCLYYYAKSESIENIKQNMDFKWSAFFMPRAVLAACYMLFMEKNLL